MATSFLRVALRFLRLCWNFVASVLFGFPGRGEDDYGGVALSSLFSRGRRSLTFDDGTRVEVGRRIAEGGFSYVFEAFPVGGAGGASYALKRISCPDREIVQACRREAGAHRSLPRGHPNLLELLGLKFEGGGRPAPSPPPSSGSSSSSRRSRFDQHDGYDACYMLFPYIPHSLRGEITKRDILSDGRGGGRRRSPFSTDEIIGLFGGLVDALMAIHGTNLSHRDVKIENVLLRARGYGDSRRGGGGAFAPVLMDLGSAGPLVAPLSSRREVLTMVENAASNTTMPYRSPELFEGGARHGPLEMLDYGKVDVWSLGCVLFGMMHGAGPFEAEFARDEGGDCQRRQYGTVRIAECTHLRILGEVPLPPWVAIGGEVNISRASDDGRHGENGKYPLSMYEFVRFMVDHDRSTRPDIHEVAKRFGELHSKLTGERWVRYEEGCHTNVGNGQSLDDFDSLIASRDFV